MNSNDVFPRFRQIDLDGMDNGNLKPKFKGEIKVIESECAVMVYFLL